MKNLYPKPKLIFYKIPKDVNSEKEIELYMENCQLKHTMKHLIRIEGSLFGHTSSQIRKY